MAMFECWQCGREKGTYPKVQISLTSEIVEESPEWDEWKYLSKEEQEEYFINRNKDIYSHLTSFCSIECAIEYLQMKGENEL
jgi:hypothetical protein